MQCGGLVQIDGVGSVRNVQLRAEVRIHRVLVRGQSRATDPEDLSVPLEEQSVVGLHSRVPVLGRAGHVPVQPAEVRVQRHGQARQ